MASTLISRLRFPMEPNAREWLSINVQRLLSRSNETGRPFHVNGITVITKARTAGGAQIGAIYFLLHLTGDYPSRPVRGRI